MKARIYKPARNAMQSGERNTKKWVLQFVQTDARYPEPIMGWTAGANTQQQFTLYFDSQEKAIKYAESKNIEWYLDLPHKRKQEKKSYADNFAYKPLTGE